MFISTFSDADSVISAYSPHFQVSDRKNTKLNEIARFNGFDHWTDVKDLLKTDLAERFDRHLDRELLSRQKLNSLSIDPDDLLNAISIFVCDLNYREPEKNLILKLVRVINLFVVIKFGGLHSLIQTKTTEIIKDGELPQGSSLSSPNTSAFELPQLINNIMFLLQNASAISSYIADEDRHPCKNKGEEFGLKQGVALGITLHSIVAVRRDLYETTRLIRQYSKYLDYDSLPGCKYEPFYTRPVFKLFYSGYQPLNEDCLTFYDYQAINNTEIFSLEFMFNGSLKFKYAADFISELGQEVFAHWIVECGEKGDIFSEEDEAFLILETLLKEYEETEHQFTRDKIKTTLIGLGFSDRYFESAN